MFSGLRKTWRKIHRRLSRNENVVRWLGLSQSAGTSEERGLVLIQIDGLSQSQFERALKRGRLPFLRKLARKKHYQLHTMYSGLPSTTPAVQGELFYGVKCAVPAFSYRDPTTGQVVRMFDNGPAAEVESRLEKKGQPLLAGGSAYCNIYSGGAAEPHFCASTLGWGQVVKSNPLVFLSIVFWHAWSIVRTATLMVLEFFLALIDFLHGQIRGRDLGRELKAITSRVAVSIGLRELMAVGASMDVTRGLPIVQVNFLGYDEQAHRRGPSSAFAHWTLKGIDDAIKRIAVAARQSQRRKYSVWIYADHGQERTVAYSRKYGRTVQKAIADVFGRDVLAESPLPRGSEPTAAQARWLHRRPDLRSEPREKLSPEHYAEIPGIRRVVDRPEESPAVEVVSMGPVGHIYPGETYDRAYLERVAETLVRQAGIPMVLLPSGRGKAIAWTQGGRFLLPQQAADVLGPEHPFLKDATQDLVCLCHHPHAGDLIICGWSLHGPAISFAQENGAHAGPGPEETRGFVFAPPEAPIQRAAARGYLRPLDLRHAVIKYLHREQTDSARPQRVGRGPRADEGPSDASSYVA